MHPSVYIAPTSELGDAGSPSSSLLNEDLTQTNNINIILKQCNTNNTNSNSDSSTNIQTSNNFLENNSFTSLLENDSVLAIADGKPSVNSKRGPGRPRKENPLLSFRAPSKQQLSQTKKKFVKDPLAQSSYSNSVLFEGSTMGSAEETSTSNSKTSSASTVHNEELPYFTEKYPGKTCCLCNLCERSSLGQGDMLKITVNNESVKAAFAVTADALKGSAEDNSDTGVENSSRKKNLTSRSKVIVNTECVNELEYVGHDEVPSLDSLVFEGCFVYIHSMCAMWSLQMKRIEEDFVPNFEEMVAKSVTRKCSSCQRYGASINCRMSCQKNYHLPCAAADGCFLIIESFQAFCVEHVSQVPYIGNSMYI